LSFLAHIDFSAKQFYAVSFVATGDVDLATAGNAMLGIVQGNSIATHAIEVARSGISKAGLVLSSAAITAGDLLEVGAGGLLQKKASGVVVAQALETITPPASGAAVIAVLLLPANGTF
jgi:hypothetical protein